MTRTRRPFHFVSLGLTAIALSAITLIVLNSSSLDSFRAFASPYVNPTPAEASIVPSPLSDDDISRPMATNGKILFESNRIGGTRKLYTMNPDGSGITCLMCSGASDPSGTGSTDPFEGYSGTFSQDGTKIAFSRNDGMIWTMNADGSNKASTGIVGFGPDWSPEGVQPEKLVFSRDMGGPFFDREIFIATLNGPDPPVNISNNPGTSSSTSNDLWPEWGAVVPGFPDGRIAYRSNRTGNADIFVASASPPYTTTNMTNNPSFEDSPTWSPDGTKIAFDSSLNGNNGFSEIWVLTPAIPAPPLSSWSRMTNDPDNDNDPTWSPDGSLILYSSYRGDAIGYDLKTVPSTPSGTVIPPTLFTNTLFPVQEYEPNWGPATAPSAVADLSIDAMTSETNLVAVGSNFHINFTLRNLGPAAATGVKIDFDPLPTNIRPFLIAGVCTLPTDRKLSCNVPNIAAGATTTYSVTFEAMQQGSVTPRATISANEPDPTLSSLTANTISIVPPGANLNVSLISLTTETPSVGREMSYTVRVKNNGPTASAATLVTITLPLNARLVSEVAGCTRAEDSRNIFCTIIGFMLVEEEKTYRVTIEPTAAGTMTLRGNVESSTPRSTTDVRSASRPLQVSDSPRPSNDMIANALALTGANEVVLGSNVNATVELDNTLIGSRGEETHAGTAAGRSIWYLWQAPARAGHVTVSTAGSDFDTLLDVYEFTAPTEAISLVKSDDDSGGNKTSKLTFAYRPGSFYYIAVDGFQKMSGNVRLSITTQLFPDLSNYRVQRKITDFTPAATCSETSDQTDPLCSFRRDSESGILTLTIRGENFTTNSKVWVDGAPPTGTLRDGITPFVGVTTPVSSTELTVLVPPNPPFLVQRIAEAGVVTRVTVASGVASEVDSGTATPEGGFTFNEVAANKAGVKSLELENAVIPPGQQQLVCGGELYGKNGGGMCVHVPNNTTQTVKVTPTWFAALAYCMDLSPGDYPLDRGIQRECADTLAQGKVLALNPQGTTSPNRVEVDWKVLLGTGAQQPTYVPAVMLSGAIPGAKRPDGTTLIGLDGGSLIGLDGGSLIGNDGSTLIGNDGSTLIGLDGGSLIGNDGSTLVGLDGGSLIGDAGSTRPSDSLWNRETFGPTGGASPKMPSPFSPADLTTKTGGYVVASGSGGSSPTVTYSYDEVTDEAIATVKMVFDDTSNPKVTDLGNVAIAMNLNPPVIKLNTAAISVNEGAGFASVLIVRTGDTSKPGSLDYTTSDGGATAASAPNTAQPGNNAGERCDFITTLGTVRFEAGETSKEIRIPIIDDNYAEASETLKLIIGNPVSAAVALPGSATITITDNDSSTGTTNPLDIANAQFFVRQQYLDLLGREPSAAELSAGTGPIVACASDEACRKAKRIDLSNTLFTQGQQAAGYVFRLYRAAFGNTQPFPNPDTTNANESKKWPAFSALSRDGAQIANGPNLFQSQVDLAMSFVLRPAFTRKYSPATLTDGPAFVDAILTTINTDLGVDLSSQRTSLINAFNRAGGAMAGRGAVLYCLAAASMDNPVNSAPLVDAEDNRAFASMLYINFRKRDGDTIGLNSLVAQLQATSDRRGFIDQFVNGSEYRRRFGPAADVPVTVSGRVTTPTGLGLRNAVVAITDSQGVRRTSTTSSFGLFSFDNVRSGESYTVGVSSKRFRFATRILQISDNLTNVNFVGLE